MLPSTSNSLEATHGQLNAKTPRKKFSWQKIYEIIQNLNTKNKTLTDHIKHNYQYEKRRTKILVNLWSTILAIFEL